MNTTSALPERFLCLEDHLDWALPTETLRRQKREASTLEEITAFYQAMLPHAPAIVAYLDAHDGPAGVDDGGSDRCSRTLFTLMLGFLEVSLSVEVHRSPVVPDGMPGDLWKPEHETAGWKNKPAIRLFPKSGSLN